MLLAYDGQVVADDEHDANDGEDERHVDALGKTQLHVTSTDTATSSCYRRSSCVKVRAGRPIF